MSIYTEKLKDPRWQKKRLEILSRDEFRCTWCSDDESTLHVHHLAYSGSDPWDIDPKLLITLCESCHEDDTFKREISEKKLLIALRMMAFSGYDIEKIANGFNKMKSFHQNDVMSSIIQFALSNEDIIGKIRDAYFEFIKKTADDEPF